MLLGASRLSCTESLGLLRVPTVEDDMRSCLKGLASAGRQDRAGRVGPIEMSTCQLAELIRRMQAMNESEAKLIRLLEEDIGGEGEPSSGVLSRSRTMRRT